MSVIYIFTRDLRVADNHALFHAYQNFDKIYPVFVLDPVQISENNKYRSLNSIRFMLQSLLSLKSALNDKLSVYEGNCLDTVCLLKKIIGTDNVIISRDYTPFAAERRDALGAVEIENTMLLEKVPNTKQNKPYSVFTPFYNAAKPFVGKPLEMPFDLDDKICKISKTSELKEICDMVDYIPDIPMIEINGGREAALKMLKTFKENLGDYARNRERPEYETSQLAGHLKFGTISAREVYQTCKSNEGFIRQLFWRDFYYNIAIQYPHVFHSSYQAKFDKIVWSTNEEHFEAWKIGKTGFPIVDAGMRQMNATGWMHNRTRMIVASFLIKDLQISWKKGERYFAQKLVDYDPAQNNGGWQWVAGCGTDAAPYFRIFNPWTQSKRFDPAGIYIKRFVEELKDIPPAMLHSPSPTLSTKYMKPIVDHAEARQKTIKMYKDSIEAQ